MAKAREARRKYRERRTAAANFPPSADYPTLSTRGASQQSTSHPPSTPSSTIAPTQTPTSAVLRKLDIPKENKEPIDTEILSMRRNHLEEIASNVACPECFQRSIHSVIVKRRGDTIIKMYCLKCRYIVFDNNAPGNFPSEKKKGIYSCYNYSSRIYNDAFGGQVFIVKEAL